MSDKEIKEQKLYIAKSYIEEVLKAFTTAKGISINIFDFDYRLGLHISLSRKWAHRDYAYSIQTLLELSPAVIASQIIEDAKLHLRIMDEDKEEK